MTRTICAAMLAIAACIPTAAESRPVKSGIHKSKVIAHKAVQRVRQARGRAHRVRAVRARAVGIGAHVPVPETCPDRLPHCVGPSPVNVGIYKGAAVYGGVYGDRPAGCPSRAWCGCWLSRHLGLNDRSLWLARNWARVGRAASGPAPGVVAVFARGRRGGHVGIVVAVLGPGRIVMLSGNDGRAVRERERSTRGVIAYRWAS